MRDYGKVAPTFWTGETGKKLRDAGREAQLVALYLVTCQSANMIGLYYLPLPTLCHETGIDSEGACKALRSLSEAGFACYDQAAEVVFVPEMARFQIGEALSKKDNRVKGVVKALEPYRKSRFYKEFCARYCKAFHLPLRSPSEGATKPLRSQEQEQEQNQEQEQEGLPGEPAADPPAPQPRKRTPRDELFDAVAAVTNSDAKKDGARIGRIVSDALAESPPYTAAEIRRLPEALQGNLPPDTPVTLGVVAKYYRWVRDPPPKVGGNGRGKSPEKLLAGMFEDN